MHKIFVALAVVLAVGSTAAAEKSDKADVVATMHQFMDSLNKGDTPTALAACADQASIIDEFPPYYWQSATTCATWAGDFETFNKTNGITEPVATIGKPRHVDITGDRAYVVFPAKFTFKQNGKRVTESGSILTAGLQKVGTGWRISGWAWSKH